jgi:hypothetical protein
LKSWKKDIINKIDGWRIKMLDKKNITEVNIETQKSYYIISVNGTGDIIRIIEEQKDHRAGGEVYPYQFAKFNNSLWMMLDDIIKENPTKEEDVLFLKSKIKKLVNLTAKLTVFGGIRSRYMHDEQIGARPSLFY